jgi:hypothetical protein
MFCDFYFLAYESILTFVRCTSYLAIGRLYANALLASLNSRILIRATWNKSTSNGHSDPVQIQVDLSMDINRGPDTESGALETSSPSIEFARLSRNHPWTSSASGSIRADAFKFPGPNLMKEQGNLADSKQLDSWDRSHVRTASIPRPGAQQAEYPSIGSAWFA